MIENDGGIKQGISGFLAIIITLVLSFGLGWYSIRESEKILTNVPESKIINLAKRTTNGEDMQDLDKLKEKNVKSQDKKYLSPNKYLEEVELN